VTWINQCIADNKDDGAKQEGVPKSCPCIAASAIRLAAAAAD
jgi:hypothetical protein